VTYSPASPRRLVWIDFQAPDLVTWVQIPTRALLTASGLLSSHQVLGVPQKFHSPLASRVARPFPEGRLSDSRRSRPGRCARNRTKSATCVPGGPVTLKSRSGRKNEYASVFWRNSWGFSARALARAIVFPSTRA